MTSFKYQFFYYIKQHSRQITIEILRYCTNIPALRDYNVICDHIILPPCSLDDTFRSSNHHGPT